MQFIPIKTRELLPPKDDLFEVFESSLPSLMEKDILIITSKIVSIHQGRCVRKDQVNKKDLVIEEADKYLIDKKRLERIFTVAHNSFSINAGVDPFHEYYVLLPENPMKIAEEIQKHLAIKYSLSSLGIIITDSHSAPLRRGVMCYAVGYFGISPLIEHGPKNEYSKWTTNAVDSVAAMAGIFLGESAQIHQRTPIVIGRNIEHIIFSHETFESSFFVKDEDDMYGMLYKNFNKKK
jgi:dihydrofolate synthase / folylpolyglutamate synthase